MVTFKPTAKPDLAKLRLPGTSLDKASDAAVCASVASSHSPSSATSSTRRLNVGCIATSRSYSLRGKGKGARAKGAWLKLSDAGSPVSTGAA